MLPEPGEQMIGAVPKQRRTSSKRGAHIGLTRLASSQDEVQFATSTVQPRSSAREQTAKQLNPGAGVLPPVERLLPAVPVVMRFVPAEPAVVPNPVPLIPPPPCPWSSDVVT